MLTMSDKLTPLGRLIQAAQDDLGWSNRELERQAGDMRGLGKSNIGKLKTETLPSFKAETIQNLAKLIRVPEVVVVQAALETMGVRYSNTEPATLEDAVNSDPSLTGRDKRVLMAALTAMKASDDSGSEDEQEPRTQAGSTVDSSEDRRKDGSTPGRRTPPMSELQLKQDETRRRQEANDTRDLSNLTGYAADEGPLMDQDGDD